MDVYKRFIALGNNFDRSKFLVARFNLRVELGVNFLDMAGGVAAESSVGTWTTIATEEEAVWQRLHARVVSADEKTGQVDIAYPVEIFERGNIANLLSSIAGNIFGLKGIAALRLLDFEAPEEFVQGFPGPKFGVEGIRKRSGVVKRPIIGSIIKPKLGLTVSQQVGVARDVFSGGGDLVKDDENLTSQEFNNFYQRVDEVLAMMREKNWIEFGEKSEKIYAFNVTAETNEMIKRAEYIDNAGGNCAMVDFVTTGFSALQTLRKRDLNVFIHGHRAMHAALTRGGTFGVSMMVLAKLARLAGVDLLHTGTVVGKMEGEKKEVLAINKFLTSSWHGLKSVFPVASGGLHPGVVPNLIAILGVEMVYNFGGGIHGHPDGSKAGAMAVRQALDAGMGGIDLYTYVEKHSELRAALEKWRART